MSSTIKVNKITSSSGSTLEFGGAGDTVSVGSGATVSGFGSPAYASNASATASTVNVDASDNLQFNSGYGSTATAYGCRAWVNFNGTGTVAINASGNMSSITDIGTGHYTANFTTAMPDVNYATSVNGNANVGYPVGIYETAGRTTSSVSAFFHNNGTGTDVTYFSVVIFR